MSRIVRSKDRAMFTVKWAPRETENQRVEIESCVFTDLDIVVASCREALYGMRLRHIASPPDGFIIADADGKELRRWFGSYPPGILTASVINPGALSKR
jgi:hypothetical protein